MKTKKEFIILGWERENNRERGCRDLESKSKLKEQVKFDK